MLCKYIVSYFKEIAGVISRGTRRNAVPIVEKLPEHREMAFSLRKYLRNCSNVVGAQLILRWPVPLTLPSCEI